MDRPSAAYFLARYVDLAVAGVLFAQIARSTMESPAGWMCCALRFVGDYEGNGGRTFHPTRALQVRVFSIAVIMAIGASGCFTPAPADRALIETARGSRIVRLDGAEVSQRKAFVSPGHHEVRFETKTELLLFSPRCGVKLNLQPGVAYRFSTKLEETRLPANALGTRWRMLEAKGVLTVREPEEEARMIELPCEDCIAFRSSGWKEEAAGCGRHRADVRIEELCRMRGGADYEQCVRDGIELVLVWPRGPRDWVLFVPGLEAEYSKEEHLEAFHACIKGDPDVEGCLHERGWEPVP